jgi:hypothetical protein
MRKKGRNLRIFRELRRVCFAQSDLQRFGLQFVPRHPVPPQNRFIIEAVDCAEGIDTKDAGRSTLIFNIRQAAERDDEFVAASAYRNLAAGLFDVTKGQIQLLTNPLQLLARTVHAIILGSTNAPNYSPRESGRARKNAPFCSRNGTRTLDGDILA